MLERECWFSRIKLPFLKSIKPDKEWNNEELNNIWVKILEIKNAFTFAVEQKET